MKDRPGPLIAVLIMLIGWVISVTIRSLQHVEVNVVAEMTGAALAVAVLYAKLGGRPPSDGGGES